MEDKELPRSMALHAPDSWQVNWSSGHPMIASDSMDLLLFGVLRQLLSLADLLELYHIVQGDIYPGQRRPSSCLISARPGRVRLVEKQRLIRRGRKTSKADAELLEELKKLAAFKVPRWVRGCRLKFHGARWYVAPPVESRGTVRTLRTRIAEVRSSDNGDPRELASLKERLRRSQSPVYTAVSRLVCFEKYGPPRSQGSLSEMFSDKVLAVHHACSGCKESRARCLNSNHMTWGIHEDNAYHRVIHDSLVTDSCKRYKSEYKQPAKKRRPAGWVPPSTRRDYVRERDRLRDTGSRSLHFE